MKPKDFPIHNRSNERKEKNRIEVKEKAKNRKEKKEK